MIAALFVSSFLVCAVPPPVAMVEGPYHKPAYMELFDHLEESEWRAAHLRYGERGHGRRVAFVGIDNEIEAAFRAAGWRILTPPIQKGQATMVFVIPAMRGNERGAARMINTFGSWVMPGGLFVLQPFVYQFEEEVMAEYAENARRFLMKDFDIRLGGIKVNHRYFDVYQRVGRRSA